MYLTNTRLDICFAVNTLSQYLVQPRRVHQIAAKHVMRYLKGTIDFGLYYDGNHDYRLYGYIYVDWARIILDRKSTSGRCFSLGSTMSLNTFETSLVLFRNTFLKRGSSDAVGFYHP